MEELTHNGAATLIMKGFEMSQMEENRIERDTRIRKIRRISAQGQVLVKTGDLVRPETVVARGTVVNPNVQKVIIYSQLGIDPDEVERYMLKEEGDEVKKDEVIAIHRSFFGRSTRICRSPIDGTIESFSKSSGSVLIRGMPIAVEVKAHLPGKVVETIPGEGAVIECRGNLIRGRFGVGGETIGELVIVAARRDESLTNELVTKEFKGKIIVGGSLVTIDALRRAASLGVNGIVVGGLDQKDLTDFLGHEIGLGVTGKEETGLTVITTEGFGPHPMDEETFHLLKSCEGKQASIDGSTQIRTRMLRPEVIIPS